MTRVDLDDAIDDAMDRRTGDVMNRQGFLYRGALASVVVFPWLAVGALGSGVASLSFVRYLWPYRGKPGGWFFVGTISCEALWSLGYGVALLTFDPALRRLLELPIWLGINFIGVFFLAFALEYTGRGSLVRSKPMGALVGLQVIHTLIVATNPLHHLAWRNYAIDPIFGAATVTYTHGPWVFVNVTGVILMIAGASFVLVDTFFSYGPLYRTQAAAVALSPVLPGIAFLVWLFKLGDAWRVNLTPLTFPLHLAFDIYAFFSRNMFELTPAARRAGERTAIDELGTAVLILDDDDRIIDLNPDARHVLDVDDETVLGRSLDAVLDGVDPAADEQTIAIRGDGGRRQYAVTTSAIRDAGSSTVGHTIVLQDITAERQREQRLAVLNRVLRHNLRNDLNVVEGYLGIARDRLEDDELGEMLATAERKTADVIELGGKARDIERAIGTDPERVGTIGIARLLRDIASDLDPGSADRIRIDVPEGVRVVADELLLDRVFRNLIENGLEHDDSGAERVEIRFRPEEDGDAAVFEINDDGPGIPEHELAVLESAEETALEHGSGLGLWLVKWGVASLGGEISFRTGHDGTTAVLELPGVEVRESSAPPDGDAST